MSNPTHLKHLKQNIEHWNHWRHTNSNIIPDLSEALLCAVALGRANLRQANLRQVDLYAADLGQADLTEADMRSAHLSGTNCFATCMERTNLAGAEFLSANLWQANLRQANLHGAKLSMANLTEANLVEADLTGADLQGAKLSQATLTGARFAGANLNGVLVSDLDMGWIAALEQVTCDHIYVQSQISPGTDSHSPVTPYTTTFRSALHEFYQRFLAACDGEGPRAHRVVWPTPPPSPGAELYLQAVERQDDSSLLVRVGVNGLTIPAHSQPQKPNYQQLFSTLGRGDYYRHQLQLREEQIATVQRQNDELLDLLKAMTRQNVYVQSVSVLENSVMTGVSKYDLRGANIGSFADTVEAGGQQQTVQYNQAEQTTLPDWEVVMQVEELFLQLSHRAAQVPPHQRPQVVGKAIQKKASVNADFKVRLLKALESGSAELIQVFTQNPYVRVPLSLVKGWVAA